MEVWFFKSVIHTPTISASSFVSEKLNKLAAEHNDLITKWNKQQEEISLDSVEAELITRKAS